MKVFIVKPNENWIVDRLCTEFKEYSRHDISFTDMKNADIIWMLAPWCWKNPPATAELLSSKKVVCTVHHLVPDKFDQSKYNDFIQRNQFVDEYHVPNSKTKEFVSKLVKKPINKIGYWCNEKLWQPFDKKEAKVFFDLPDDKLIVSSFQRDTEGSDLITPKLEKGPDRFCNYVKELSKKYSVHVLLGGWRRQYVMRELNNFGIPFTYVEFPEQETISKMYSATDLYVVGSRYEGGPQALLECGILNIPIVSDRAGMAEDILPESCLLDMSNPEIYIPNEKDIEIVYNNTRKFVLENHVKKYDDLLERVFND